MHTNSVTLGGRIHQSAAAARD